MFVGYVAVFAVAALASGAGAFRARQIADPDTRHGLVALLLLSGGWALAQIGVLVVPGKGGKIGLYLFGLIVGFATVWAWLYFCSAYSGRSLHQNRTVRNLSLVVFAGIALAKITNPLHHLYFTTEWVSSPFSHLAIQNHLLHWITLGLAYSLATVGLFVLFELFAAVSSGTRPLSVLVGLTTLPALLDAASYASSALPAGGYEPIGVAAFAVGVLFVYNDQFQDARVTGQREAPALVIGACDELRAYNDRAAALFPTLADGKAVGRPLDEAVPELAEARTEHPPLLVLRRSDTPRYFRIGESRLGAGTAGPGHLLLLTDVTDQKQREAALRAAKEEAEKTSRLRSAMLANMSHEIRTPLTSVMSFAGILKNNLSGQNARYAELVLQGGDRLMSTLDSVLRLSKLEAGTWEVERERVSLTEVVETTVELLRPKVEENGLALNTCLPDPPVQGRWDEDALYHIVENLLENAIKFTPEDGRVTVRLRREDDQAVLEVEDTGVGISEEARAGIFDAFRQESEGLSRKYEGSGLGLSIVQKMTEALDGGIDVQSEKGVGSCFTVRLPQ